MNTQYDSRLQKVCTVLMCISLVLGASFLGGCASTSGAVKAAETGVLSKIVKGVTTKEEVRKLLGESNGVTMSSSGIEQWTYQYSDAQAKMLGLGAVAAAGQVVSAFIPFAGLITSAPMAMPTKTTFYTTMIEFNAQGIVTGFSSSKMAQ